MVTKLIDWKIRYLLNHHYERVSAILYNEFGRKYITTRDAEKAPPGFEIVKGYVRRNPHRRRPSREAQKENHA